MRALAWRLERSYRRRLLDADLVDAAGALAGTVLEVGAGRRGRRGAFRPPAAARWITVDRASRTRPDACADVGALPFADGAFDAVVCLEVLEYVARPRDALCELARVARAGATVLVSVPFGHRQDAPDDLWRFTAAGLALLAADAGLSVEAVRPQGGALAVVANTLKHAAWGDGAPLVVRLPLGLVALALGEVLVRLDAALARSGAPRSFSTGHLVVARKR